MVLSLPILSSARKRVLALCEAFGVSDKLIPSVYTTTEQTFDPGPKGPLVPVIEPGLGNRD